MTRKHPKGTKNIAMNMLDTSYPNESQINPKIMQESPLNIVNREKSRPIIKTFVQYEL